MAPTGYQYCVPTGLAGRAGRPAGTEAALRDAEARLHGRARAQPQAAYRACLAPDTWLMRPDAPVRKTRDAALRLLGDLKVQSCQFTPKGAGVARSGDLAYTYGEARVTYRQDGGAKERPGFYLRTWRYTGRDWQLVGELLNHQ